MMRTAALGLAIVFLAGPSACAAPDPERVPPADAEDRGPAATTAAPARDGRALMPVQVFFTRDEEPVPVTREVPRTDAVLRAALEVLLYGPTEEERAQGIWSFFSKETAGMLRGVSVDEAGHAIVDFEDLRPLIPNASSSAGSRILLGELNSTIFQLPTVRTIEYRIEGSCEAFGEWLQYGCVTFERPGG